jgi:hypothetical protein
MPRRSEARSLSIADNNESCPEEWMAMGLSSQHL